HLHHDSIEPSCSHSHPLSFPTRRSSDLAKVIDAAERAANSPGADNRLKAFAYANAMVASQNLNKIDDVLKYGDKVLAIDPNDLKDRKSTRMNSSHQIISNAVFCLKKEHM